MNRQKLLDVLSVVKEALSTQDIIPIYGNFAFDGDCVTAYDDIVAIEYPIEFELECCIKGVPLYSYLENLNCKSVEVEVTKDDNVVVKGGRSKITLPYTPVTEFTFNLPNLKDASVIPLDPDFITGLESCLLSVNPTGTHLYTTGISMYEDRNEGLMLFSTDHKTLSRYKLRAQRKGKKAIKGYVLFPEKFCKLLIKMAQSHEPLELKVTENNAVALFKVQEGNEKVVVFTKLLDPSEVPDFKETYKERAETEDTELSEVPKEAESMLKRASVIFSSNITEKILHLKMGDDEISVRASTALGDFKEVLKVDDLVCDIDMCDVSLDLLTKGFKNCEAFSFLRDNIFMVAGDDDEFSYLIGYSDEEED